jgi:hypothetical protein
MVDVAASGADVSSGPSACLPDDSPSGGGRWCRPRRSALAAVHDIHAFHHAGDWLVVGISRWSGDILGGNQPANRRILARVAYAVLADVASGRIELTAHHYPVVAVGMAVILMASFVIGGLAIRRYAPVCESK